REHVDAHGVRERAHQRLAEVARAAGDQDPHRPGPLHETLSARAPPIWEGPPEMIAALVAIALVPHAQVVRVVDGDTVAVRSGGKPRSYDLLGVAAPAAADCHGAAAKRALARLLPRHARVTLRADPKGPRTARYVYRRGSLVNAALIRSGDARAAPG